MTSIVISETFSTQTRIETIARLRGNVQFTIDSDGKVSQLAPDAHMTVDLHIVMLRARKGPTLFTRWCMSYVVPPLVQLEALWATVQRLLQAHPKIPAQFGGAFPTGFVWGSCPDASGIVARERSAVNQGGLFPEHYCLCRARGFEPESALALSIQAAKQGGQTPIPEVA